MTSFGTPRAEVEVSADLLRQLVMDQFPELAKDRITLLDSGWDNLSFRIGEEHVARMPRRESAVVLLANEQKWLPLLGPQLPLAVPIPLAIGQPGRGYPWPWSLLPYLPGEPADLGWPLSEEAERFALFLSALHRIPAENAPENAFRGVPIRERASSVEERLDRLRTTSDEITPEIDSAWRLALDEEPFDPVRERVWLHGDLHARNVLVESGRLSAIIDWGDLTAGDAATDLASIWMLFEDPAARKRAFDTYDRMPPRQPLRVRARGWAVLFGAVLLDSGLIDNPRHAAMGRAVFARIRQDG
jgi:aminoglycoside phosphotransferase (APT) family kinase protein